jgi:peptide/nickel transport system permease protein
VDREVTVITVYIIRRVLAVIPVMLIVVTVVFLLIHLIPGDPVAVILGPDASPAQMDATRRQLGLDRPLHVQLLAFYARVLQGDLGRSYFLDRPVAQALWERAEPTALLTLSALLVAVALGVPAGLVAGAHPGSMADRVLMIGALLGVCIPGFWLSLNLIYLFAVQLGWLPAGGYASVFVDPAAALRFMVLPAVSLGFNQSALIARIARSCMLEVLQQDYIRTARAKGLAERVVVVGHAFRNAMVPVVTVIGITTAILIGGAVVTEIVFNIPGLGRLIISAILRRDYPVVQGVVLVTAAAYVLINLVVDVLYVFIDPRIRHG